MTSTLFLHDRTRLSFALALTILENRPAHQTIREFVNQVQSAVSTGRIRSNHGVNTVPLVVEKIEPISAISLKNHPSALPDYDTLLDLTIKSIITLATNDSFHFETSLNQIRLASETSIDLFRSLCISIDSIRDEGIDSRAIIESTSEWTKWTFRSWMLLFSRTEQLLQHHDFEISKDQSLIELHTLKGKVLLSIDGLLRKCASTSIETISLLIDFINSFSNTDSFAIRTSLLCSLFIISSQAIFDHSEILRSTHPTSIEEFTKSISTSRVNINALLNLIIAIIERWNITVGAEDSDELIRVMKVVENNLVQSRLGDRMDELLTFETEETILHILEWIWTVEEDCAAAVT